MKFKFRKFIGYPTNYAWSIIYTIVCSIGILLGIYLLYVGIIDPYTKLCQQYDITFEASK